MKNDSRYLNLKIDFGLALYNTNKAPVSCFRAYHQCLGLAIGEKYIQTRIDLT